MGSECTLLSGYGYEIVSKWDFGEQIKITTTFESDVHSALSLKDESYLKVNYYFFLIFNNFYFEVNFEENINADLYVYYPLEQSTSSINGTSASFELTDQAGFINKKIL